MRKATYVLLVVIAVLSAAWMTKDNTGQAQITGVPIGSVIAWSGPKSKIPTGWIECDGRQLNRNQFSALFDAIGTTWGGTATDRFNLPDLRGYFLRGVDDGAGRDPDVSGRRPVGNGPANSAGSIQDDALKSHRHDVSDPGHSHSFEAFRTDGAGAPGQAFPRDPNPFGTSRATTGITIPESGGGPETRPKNAYVYFIIRAR
jgi:microcystin-dependent protein